MHLLKALIEIKTAVPDELIESMLDDDFNVMAGPSGKAPRGTRDESVLVQLNVYALEAGVPVVILVTPSSAYLLVRKNSTEGDDAALAEDEEKGKLVWEFVPIAGRRKDEGPPVKGWMLQPGPSCRLEREHASRSAQTATAHRPVARTNRTITTSSKTKTRTMTGV